MCFRFCKCVISATISILIGVAVGILFFNALIPGISTAVIISLILSALALLLLTIIGASGRENECVCRIGKCTLIGAISTLILGTIASVLTLVTASIGFAILIGLLGAAFFFTIFSIAELVGCVIECKCNYNCNK
ncbi:MAG: hypothetical protein HFJ17_00535 [Clostridia bacterium]|nr:hypothetical protein [Clostridia bacterium]